MQIETQKITTHIPVQLLKQAQAVTHVGITHTIKIALEHLAREKAYDNFLELQGAHHFSLDLNELRQDKGEQ